MLPPIYNPTPVKWISQRVLIVTENKKWTVQRRNLWDEGPHSWDTVMRASEREDAEHQYRRLIMYIQCREIRLLSPEGEIALCYHDPSYFHYRACSDSLALRLDSVVGGPHPG